MPKITLALDENKRLDGISEQDKKRYAKFKYRIANLGSESISFEWHEVRSGPYHRRFFAMLAAIHSSQDVFDDIDKLRLWLEISAGHVEYYPMIDTGEMIAVPKSIAYEKLDQQEFHEVAESIWRFARSEHARSYLWSHLSNDEQINMIESLLLEFE